jgi:hypothetical protein
MKSRSNLKSFPRSNIIMATNAAKSTRNTRKSTGRRTGRPTNAERAARVQSETVNLIKVAAASYATGMANALGIDPSAVQTIGTVAQTGQAQPVTGTTSAQPAQTQPSGQRRTTARKAPGRKVNPDSKMSLTRQFYAENLKLPADQRLDRAAFVKAAAKKFKYTPQTANTYISNIERVEGRKLARRGTGAGAARGRSRGSNGDQNTGTNG